MDFELTPDQVDLRDGVRKLLGGRFPMATVRALEASGGVDRALWRELGDAGVFSLRESEADGGAGLGSPEAVLVFEELGRALVPGPLIGSHIAAAGDIVTMVERDNDPLLVDYLDVVDRVLVLDDTGVYLLDPSTIEAEPLIAPLDPLTPLHRVRALPAGEQIGDAAQAARWTLEATVFASALLLGIASATTELAVAYAHERQQFDRPIGSFQAVKHMLADMLTREEVARAAVYAAGVMLDDPAVGDPVRAASVAKLIAGEAALFNGKTCIQVHGGMGFTWEVDAHLYLKRAWVLETVCGGADHHAERLGSQL